MKAMVKGIKESFADKTMPSLLMRMLGLFNNLGPLFDSLFSFINPRNQFTVVCMLLCVTLTNVVTLYASYQREPY